MKTLTKYQPLDTVDELFDRFRRELLPTFDRFLARDRDDWSEVRLPVTNVNETDTAYVFTVEMPGLTRKDVEVSVEGDALVVKGERPEKIDRERLLRDEIRTTRFERSYALPSGADRDNIKATMKDGLLTVELAKAPDKVGRRITVD